MPTYTVDRVKFFRGMEGNGWNCRLLRDGLPVAHVIDDASGGEVMFEWLDIKDTRVDVIVRRYDKTMHTYRGTPEEAIFARHVMGLPMVEVPGLTGEDNMVYASMDIVVDDMVSRIDLEKRVKALVKRSFCCLRPDGQVVTWALKTTPEAKLRAHVAAKFPEYKIINDMPLEEQVKLLSAG